MNISKAQLGDLPRILEIQKEAYLAEAAIYDDYSLPPLLQTLEEIEQEAQSKVFLRAEESGQILGSVRAHLVGDTCHIGRLIVDPKFQRRGIGSALLAEAENVFPQAIRVELFTGSRSESNIRLYERHGYRAFRTAALSPSVTLIYMCRLRSEHEVAKGRSFRE